jgi:hypothetical protein
VSPLLVTQLDASRVLGLVSFDCHAGSPFFSHRRRMFLLLDYVFSFRHHSLSLRRRPLLIQQQHSLSLLKKSLARSVCLDVPAGLSRSPPLAARPLSISFNFSPQKAGAAAGQPRPRARQRKVLADVDHAVLRAVATAVTLPPILLLAVTLAL